MPEFFDYDPLRRITSYFDYEESTGIATIRREENVAPLLAYCAEMRNVGASDDKLKDDNYMCCYAMLPATVIAELYKKGIDISNPGDGKALMRELETNYSHFKTTYKHHDR